MDTHFAPNKTIQEVADSIKAGHLDPLRDFSEACRDELRAGVVARELL